MEGIEDAADNPFVANTDCGRAVETPETASALLVGHGPVLMGFLRVMGPRSPDGDIGTPLACGEG